MFSRVPRSHLLIDEISPYYFFTVSINVSTKHATHCSKKKIEKQPDFLQKLKSYRWRTCNYWYALKDLIRELFVRFYLF